MEFGAHIASKNVGCLSKSNEDYTLEVLEYQAHAADVFEPMLNQDGQSKNLQAVSILSIILGQSCHYS